MGIPLLTGRDFTDRDTSEMPMGVVISEKMAQRFWPGQDPIGKRIKPGSTTSDSPWREVIGVVKDVRQNDFLAEPKMQMYMSYRQLKTLAPNALVIRTSVEPMSIATAVRRCCSRSQRWRATSRRSVLPASIRWWRCDISSLSD